jgi:excisionase family DNA binding protein
MEKISIVRRRKTGLKEPGVDQSPDSGLKAFPEQESNMPTGALTRKADNNRPKTDISEGFAENNSGELSVKLTPEQYKVVESSQYLGSFLNGEASGVSLDVQHNQDGQIVFNFQFKKVDTVRLLKAEHVCQMLQISKTLLVKLVKTQKIKSYKIGALRRFLLEDILNYLASSEEFADYHVAKESQEAKNDVL